ncbi:IS630 family transposase [Paraburkholderia humisilvae]|uniref:IS630 family transposase n=1 Tax=Paraburkholderia humisilvae TaxID=627669 RepID=UPI00361215DE
MAIWREGGYEALRGKAERGRPTKLSLEGIRFVYQAVTTANPLQMNFNSTLWTRDMVRLLIQERFAVELSDVSVSRLLRKLGFAPRRPLAHAYESDWARVDSWTREQYPAIVRKAKRRRGHIFFVDESAVSSRDHVITFTAPMATAPVAQEADVKLISAINPRGQQRFMSFKGDFSIPVYVEFARRLLLNADEPIFLIADRHPVHCCEEVMQLAAESEGRLWLFFLPV